MLLWYAMGFKPLSYFYNKTAPVAQLHALVSITNGCIIIRQIQLLVLRLMGQGISDNVQRSLPVQYSDGQFIHTFEPTCLTSTKIRLHKYMLPWFVISINGSRYTVYVTSPLDTRLVYRQQFFLAPTIVAFRRSVLATMVCNGV